MSWARRLCEEIFIQIVGGDYNAGTSLLNFRTKYRIDCSQPDLIAVCWSPRQLVAVEFKFKGGFEQVVRTGQRLSL